MLAKYVFILLILFKVFMVIELALFNYNNPVSDYISK